MEPELFLIQSGNCRKEIVFGELCLWVDLPASYHFKERASVRLHSVAGLSEDLYVVASFARTVPCGNTFRRVVGLTNSLPGPKAIVDGIYIGNQVTIQLGRINEKPFTEVPKKPFALLFELNGGPTCDSRV